jgi:thiol-disulfide isomerase/thioredoxin
MFPAVLVASYGRYDDTMTSSTFDLELAKPGLKAAFIKFAAPWCTHCRDMEPYWVDLGEEHEDDTGLLIGSVDCTEVSSKPLCTRFNIQGLPTLFYFMPPDPAPEIYNGNQTMQALGDFMTMLQSGVCYPGARGDCNATQLEALNLLEKAGVEHARAKFLEIRGHLMATRREMEETVAALQSGHASPEDQEKLKEKAKFANDVLKTIEAKVGPEYMQLKAFLTAHGGAGTEGEAAGTSDAMSNDAEAPKKKKAKKKRKSKGNTKDEV